MKFKEYLLIFLFSALFSFFVLFFSSLSKFIVFYFLIFLIAILCFILYCYPSLYFFKVNKYIQNLSILLSSVFLIIFIFESYLHLGEPAFLGLNHSILCKFTDFTGRKYLDESVFVKKNGIFRIMGLGDSFAVDLRESGKNYHNIMQNKLDLVYGKGKVEVVNAGMECIGPGYYFGILNQYGDLIKPDLVLIGFFIGNDFQEMHFNTLRYGQFIYEDICSSAKERYKKYFRFRNFWTYRFFTNKLKLFREAIQQKRELKDGTVKEKGSFSKKEFLKIERHRMHIFECNKAKGLEKSWNNNSKVILEMKKWCDRRGIQLIIAIFQDQFQVEEDLRNEVIEKYNLQNTRIDIRYPNKLIINFCKEHNIRTVDLLEPFLIKSKFKKLYLIRNTHWNEDGNRVAADTIYDYIVANSLIQIE